MKTTKAQPAVGPQIALQESAPTEMFTLVANDNTYCISVSRLPAEAAGAAFVQAHSLLVVRLAGGRKMDYRPNFISVGNMFVRDLLEDRFGFPPVVADHLAECVECAMPDVLE